MSQYLFYPMMDAYVSAGYLSDAYRKGYGYPHYGMDFDERGGKGFDVIAGGEGTVLGVEKNQNSIGGVVVIRYDGVIDPGGFPPALRSPHLPAAPSIDGILLSWYNGL